MRKIQIHIIILLSCISVQVSSQVVDTTKSINAWKLMHNYSRFEDTELDTTMFALHKDFNPLNRNGFAYEHVGLLGHAAQNLYFFDRPGTSDFLFGSGMNPYLANPDRTIFYNTRKPFTEFIYTNLIAAEGSEEAIRFLHTQNMDPFSNIGIDLEILSGKEFFDNQLAKATKFTLFGSRAKEKYSAFGTFHFNRFNTRENGGLKNPNGFRKDSISDILTYDGNLNDASASYTNLKLFYTQKFNLSEKLFFTDTMGVTTDSGKNVSFNHQLVVERNSRMYMDQDLSILSDFYNNYYYFSDEIKDSIVQDQISNTFQFILGDPYTDKLSARVYAGHEFARYGQRSPDLFQTFAYFDTLSHEPLALDSIFKDTASTMFNNKYSNELFVGFHIAGPPENEWYWNVDAKYYLAGYYRNNFIANATFSRQVFSDYRLGLKGNIENKNVSYYHNHYSSAFFKWDNDFKGSQIIKGEAFLTNREKHFDAAFSMGLLTNYIYWDENALPTQYDKVISIFTGKLSAKFSASSFNSVNHLLVQYTTADEVLRLPLVAVKTSNFWKQKLFKGALIAELGIDFYITTPYIGNAYMPAIGIFYLQNDEKIGGYPYADAFLAFRIKRVRLFGSYSNGFSLINNNYFTAAGYPTKPAYVRFGLAWTFYD
jgi:hypothetical protein